MKRGLFGGPMGNSTDKSQLGVVVRFVAQKDNVKSYKVFQVMSAQIYLKGTNGKEGNLKGPSPKRDDTERES